MKPFLTIQELKTLLARKEVSVSEVVQFYQARIKAHNPQLNAMLETFQDPVLPNDQNVTGLLGGIPCVIKDNILQKDRIASAGSKMLEHYQAPYDSTASERLKKAGAFSLGRANMDEFAMGSSGEFSAFGPTHNPWKQGYVAGGSSSGPAAAVAAGLVPFALGTETGGSVRHPASYCSLVGMYPTHGHNSRYGVIAFTSSTDQVGPLTKTVYDNALVMSALSGFDEHDSTSIQQPPQNYTKGLDGKLPTGLKVGIIRDGIETDGLNPEVRSSFDQAIEQLKKLGADIKIIDLPHFKYGIALYFIISRAEAASNLSRFDGSLYGHRSEHIENLFDMYLHTRQEGFGIEIKRRILVGNYVLSAGHQDQYYNKAQQVRSMVRAEFDQAFKDVDVLISPTTSNTAFKMGELVNDPIALYMDDFYSTANCIIGTPGISIPCGFSSQGLPIGFQILGPRLSEHMLYKVAYAFEQSTDYHLHFPGGYE